MYKLTLTHDERDAMDFVGYRYPHGTELYKLLWLESKCAEGLEWDGPEDIEFSIPENVAWRIAEIVDESNLELFDSELKYKIWKFRGGIV